jgi:hypothetical protein
VARPRGVLLSAVLVLDALLFIYARTAGAHTRAAGVIWSDTTSSEPWSRHPGSARRASVLA